MYHGWCIDWYAQCVCIHNILHITSTRTVHTAIRSVASYTTPNCPTPMACTGCTHATLTQRMRHVSLNILWMCNISKCDYQCVHTVWITEALDIYRILYCYLQLTWYYSTFKCIASLIYRYAIICMQIYMNMTLSFSRGISNDCRAGARFFTRVGPRGAKASKSLLLGKK